MTVLRPLRADDIDALVALQGEGAALALGHIFPQDTHPFPYDEVRARWREELADPAIDCFAVEDDAGGLAGFAATRGEEFLHLGTAVRAWGSGLAAAAHEEVLAHLQDQGHAHPVLRRFELTLPPVR